VTRARVAILAGVVSLLGFGVAAVRQAPPDRFDHEKHQKVFPECAGCHVSFAYGLGPVFPSPAICASCHDGVVKRTVNWSPPPPESRPSNFRFTHAEHARRSGLRLPQDSTIFCTACHVPTDAGRMSVRRTISAQCLACHGVRAVHLSAPDTACGTCHLPLTRAVALPAERVARFPKPPTHDRRDFLTSRGHGQLAKASTQSCAVCHARDFCTQCHVNAPEVAAIQTLERDPRARAIKVELGPPATHLVSKFALGGGHGALAREDVSRCAFCHTRQSCEACHRYPPSVVLRLPSADTARAVGAVIDRGTAAPHHSDFAERHPSLARATPAKCNACHARTECLGCHRPVAASAGIYHPPGFVTRHPAMAYNRQADCATCHNQGAFCATCHLRAGIVSPGRLQQSYHDASPRFQLNHGTAARQNIASCVTCHAESDCLACHSAQGGRRFNPHGPGFDAKRLRRENPQTCAACHGRNIPP